MSKKPNLLNSEISTDIPEIILKNLIRHGAVDPNFDFDGYTKQIMSTTDYKEFCISKMQQEYKLEEEIVQVEYNTFENLPKHVTNKKKGKKSKKKKNKTKRS